MGTAADCESWNKSAKGTFHDIAINVLTDNKIKASKKERSDDIRTNNCSKTKKRCNDIADKLTGSEELTGNEEYNADELLIYHNVLFFN
jgi:hypothetical protein